MAAVEFENAKQLKETNRPQAIELLGGIGK